MCNSILASRPSIAYERDVTRNSLTDGDTYNNLCPLDGAIEHARVVIGPVDLRV